jgi:hypothetical protein
LAALFVGKRSRAAMHAGVFLSDGMIDRSRVNDLAKRRYLPNSWPVWLILRLAIAGPMGRGAGSELKPLLSVAEPPNTDLARLLN